MPNFTAKKRTRQVAKKQHYSDQGFSQPVDTLAKRRYNNDMFEHSGGGRRQRLCFQLWITDV
jgi:hypothetical protein